MTVSSSTSRSGPYAGAGTTGPFPVGFRFLDEAHLLVVVTDALGAESTLVLNSDYTVVGTGADSGGTVTLADSLLVGTSLTIQRNVPMTQLLDYAQSDSFPAESHEAGLDKLTMIAQQQQNTLNGALRVPETAPVGLFPAAAARALKFAAFDSTGAPAVMGSLPVGSFTNGNAIMDAFVGDGVALVFTLSQNPGSLANLSVSVGGVVQHNGDDFTWSTGTQLTFEAPPPNLVPIMVRYTNAQALASATDSAITIQRAEAGAVPRTLQFYIRHSRQMAANFCDPVNDSPAQTSANLATAIAAAIASGKVLEFDPGAIYTVDNVVNFLGLAGLKRLRFWGNGCTIFRHTGAGPVATLDSGGDSSRCDEIEFLDFTLKGQPLSTYGLDTRFICRSRIRASAIDVATAGFRFRGGVTTDHDVTLSSNVDAFAVIPANGVIISQTGSGIYPANCDYRVVTEAPITGIGVDYQYGALGNTFRGTCEGVGTGFRQRSTAGDCVLREMDFEANTVQDVLVEGRGLKFVDGESSSAGASPNFQITATASDVTLRGGFVRQVDIHPSAVGTTINDLTVSDFPTLGITGAGASHWRGSGNVKVDTSRVWTADIPDQLGAVGSFACGLTGCTTVPASAVEYIFNGGVVTLNIPTMSATSNTTSATVTGMPVALRPAVARTFPIIVINNSGNAAGMLTVETTGVMTLALGVSTTGFANSLGKGLLTTSISYKV